MKIPRDLTGKELARVLQKRFGYEVTRQRGSHIRLTTFRNGQHHITIPEHDPIKTGTLSSILVEVADHCGFDKGELLNELFR